MCRSHRPFSQHCCVFFILAPDSCLVIQQMAVINRCCGELIFLCGSFSGTILFTNLICMTHALSWNGCKTVYFSVMGVNCLVARCVGKNVKLSTPQMAVTLCSQKVVLISFKRALLLSETAVYFQELICVNQPSSDSLLFLFLSGIQVLL